MYSKYHYLTPTEFLNFAEARPADPDIQAAYAGRLYDAEMQREQDMEEIETLTARVTDLELELETLNERVTEMEEGSGPEDVSEPEDGSDLV